MDAGMPRKTLSLFHPFSPKSIGVPEASVPQLHSKPHVAALRHLVASGWTCYADYLSERRLAYNYTDGEITWRYFPISRTLRNKRREPVFKRESSYWALALAALSPPDLLVLNMSAHTSAMTRAMGKVVARAGRPYLAMLGGVNYTLNDEVVEYYRNASTIISHTHWQAREIAAVEQLGNSRVRVLPLGVDCEHFRPAHDRRPDGSPMLLFVGRWLELKGIHHAVEALRVVKARHAGAKLHIVGPYSSPPYVERVRAQIRDAGLEDAVSITGLVPYDHLVEWYQIADFLLLPSTPGLESFGMVIVESLACGTPVVALKAEGGGPNEIITHGEDGFLVKADQIGPTLLQVLEQPQAMARMRITARRKAVEYYSIGVTQSAFFDIVTEVTR